MNSRIKRGLQIAVLGGGMWALSAGIASADTPMATPPGVTLTNPTNATTVAGNNTSNGAQPTNGRSDATSLTGVVGLNASSTSTGLGNNQATGNGNRSDVVGNNTGNGASSSTFAGGLALGLSSSSTNSGGRSFTDRGNRSGLLGNNTGNGASSSTFTGGLALGLSSTSTNSGGNRLL